MPTYTPLQSIELTSASASVTFSNIPQNYQDLVVSINGYAAALNGVGVGYRINGDSSSLYSLTYLLGNGTTTASARASNSNAGYVSYGVGWNTAVTSPSVIISSINNYSNTSTFKTVLSRSNSASGSYPGAEAIISLYRSTSAINSLTFFGYSTMTFAAGTTFDLYGISPVAANNAQAFGGTEIYYDSSYVYHVFKGSGTFTPYRNLTADVLVIAGGGAGGGVYGGGGGAGGVSYQTSRSATSGTNYTVTIGAGGASANTNAFGGNGSNSVFDTITSNGGGGGGYWAGQVGFDGVSGGSGGGGGMGGTEGQTTSGGSATQGNSGGATGYGNAGGGGRRGTGSAYFGGGGGGSGVAGQAATSTAAGVGGNGLNTWSSWATVTGTGIDGYFAGGGGGAEEYATGTAKAGGLGGGGAGSIYNTSGAVGGVYNTGSGGGGRVAGSTFAVSGSGGSGIVIIRYAR